jgi:hypothetical protein
MKRIYIGYLRAPLTGHRDTVYPFVLGDQSCDLRFRSTLTSCDDTVQPRAHNDALRLRHNALAVLVRTEPARQRQPEPPPQRPEPRPRWQQIDDLDVATMFGSATVALVMAVPAFVALWGLFWLAWQVYRLIGGAMH